MYFLSYIISSNYTYNGNIYKVFLIHNKYLGCEGIRMLYLVVVLVIFSAIFDGNHFFGSRLSPHTPRNSNSAGDSLFLLFS